MSRAPVRVRAARATDLPAVMRIEQASFSDPWSRDSYAALVDAPHAAFDVAVEDDEHVLGHAVTFFAVDEAELGTIASAPDHRRRGVARALLDGACRAARGHGARRLFLEVRASNAPAQALYRDAGFVEVGRRARYYNRPVEDAVVMRLELAPEAG